jgi:transposase
MRTLLAWLRGEPGVCSMVPIPDVVEEDGRRSVRERQKLIGERLALLNEIDGVLATLGVTGYRCARTGARGLRSCARRRVTRCRPTPRRGSGASSTGWSW